MADDKKRRMIPGEAALAAGTGVASLTPAIVETQAGALDAEAVHRLLPKVFPLEGGSAP